MPWMVPPFFLIFLAIVLPGILSFHSQSPRRLSLLRGQKLFAAKDGDEIKLTKSNVNVGKLIGSGSYGRVHLVTLGNEQTKSFIGKRPARQDELSDTEDPRRRASRCLYYWQVEDHCFSKLPPHPQLPPYYGTRDDWMLFDLVGDGNTPAPTLLDLMAIDCNRPQDLKHIGNGLECSSYAETLDKTLVSLLTVLDHVHDHKIVHRDIKPGNLLVHAGEFLLMDFGSAADLEPIPGSLIPRRRGLEDGCRVAVSPIYCAPEVYIDVRDHPTAFDIFSSGLLFSQLLFGYLEERMDAGFHQQLEETDWDLNIWLSNALGSKLRPLGLDNALEYLGERPGLWTLLQLMLSKDPAKRPSAKEAIKYIDNVLKGKGKEDGPFFNMVLESMETCPIPTLSRPLHYVATFSRQVPLGLILSEVDEEDDPFWREATKNAEPGEVFVKGFVPDGQADKLGIFEIGDQLQGIGEFPFSNGGFEKAVEMLGDQPKNVKNVKLHFDRISVRSNEAILMLPSEDREIQIEDVGAWSSKGKRKSQEDAFVLHEIHDTKERSVLVAGVMDGHGGLAASTMVSSELPSLLSNELIINRRSVPNALEEAWERVCKMYQEQCTDPDLCVADYDPRLGALMANTGSEDLVAGTTASVMALDEKTGKLTVLNCGDSRTMVVNSQGRVQFTTKDHTPQTEDKRLCEGIQAGLNYSLPKCRMSRWCLTVGDYEYSVGRSLEGPFATSKGIVSDPDVTTIPIKCGEILVSASDGLWEVMDSDEVAIDINKMRAQGMTAKDTARTLCSMAIKKGTSDNVSTVVIFL